MVELILASASPRRRQLLAVLGVPFQAIDVDADETPLPDELPVALAERLAQAKATAGARQYPGQVSLGADTVVALGEESIGKPCSVDEAVRTLQRLRGVEHRVITAVAAAQQGLEDTEPRIWARVAVARVWMRPYTQDEILAYVASGDPFDKAGSYAVQHAEFRPVARIEGCFLTVVGLPLPESRAVLVEAGLALPQPNLTSLRAVCPDCIDEKSLSDLSA